MHPKLKTPCPINLYPAKQRRKTKRKTKKPKREKSCRFLRESSHSVSYRPSSFSFVTSQFRYSQNSTPRDLSVQGLSSTPSRRQTDCLTGLSCDVHFQSAQKIDASQLNPSTCNVSHQKPPMSHRNDQQVGYPPIPHKNEKWRSEIKIRLCQVENDESGPSSNAKTSISKHRKGL